MTERPQKITFGEMREMGVRGRAAIAAPTCVPDFHWDKKPAASR